MQGGTRYGKLTESIIEIGLDAAKDAIDSVGIIPKDIQAGYISNVFGVSDKQVHMAPVIMSNLGIPSVPGLTIESACGSGSVMFREAYANISSWILRLHIGTWCREDNPDRHYREHYFIFLLF